MLSSWEKRSGILLSKMHVHRSKEKANQHTSIYGDTEELLGKWFQRTGKRNEISLASKFGIVIENLQFKGIDSSAEYCKRACEASLKKLATDYIDLCEFLLLSSRFCVAFMFFLSTNFNQIMLIVLIREHQLKRRCEQW